MNSQDDLTPSSADSESIYRAPTADTRFAPAGDLLAAYVGPKNADYYARCFARFKTTNSTVSWNWPAFFLASLWFLYRKMWLYAFGYWLVMPVVLVVLSVFAEQLVGEAASSILYNASYLLIAFVLAPMFANRLYYGHAQSKVNKVVAITSSPEQQSIEAARVGGTSNVVLVVVPFILIAVLGILAAIAIPAYQDYTIRAQVSEGLNLSGGVKAAVAELYIDTGEVANDNAHARLSPASEITGKYVTSVAVDRGDIVITYGFGAHTVIAGKTILLTFDNRTEDQVNWTCSSSEIAGKHLPAACR